MTFSISANQRVRVNVRSVANMAAIREEKRNGRNVIIVPSATMPDDVVMNGVKYPAGEIEASFASLNRKPAPLGHPLVNGQFVSASDPEGINLGWIGAWNENVRRENGRVFLDKVIDVDRANQSEEGKSVLAAIEAGDPVHTSTGLFCTLDAANGEDGCDYIARNIDFDHDAILLHEEGAATPEQGVGMMVNKDGKAEQITVINSALDEADKELDWAVDHLARALERREKVPMLERMRALVLEMFGSAQNEPSSNERNMDMDKEQFDALSAKVDDLAAANEKIGETIANAVTEAVKPIVDAQAEMKANQEAKDKADKDALVNKVVEAKIDGFDKDVAEKMDVPALNALLKMHGTKKAAPLSGGFAINTGQDEEDFSPLAAVKGAN